MQITTRYKNKLNLKPSHVKLIKNLLAIAMATLIIVCTMISVNNSSLTTYKNLFFDEKYIEAKNYYDKKSNSFVIKQLSFNREVTAFLSSQLNNTVEKYHKNEINNEVAISLINEIKGYNLLNEEPINLAINKIEGAEALKGINALLKEGKDFESVLKVIEDTEKKYPDLEGLSPAKSEALNSLKTVVLTEAKTSLEEKNFDDAIAKLESKVNYFAGDGEYEETLKTYKAKKEEEIKRIEEEKKKAAAAMVVNTKLNRNDFATSEEFINTTNLSSSKPYLIYVNLENQSTEIFTGSKGNWKLLHSFVSATGKSNTPTPKGVYKVTGRGSWFFSQQFGEGAKWYVQFWGDYLFHSLPMDRNKNVVDPTLGTPASHGCVRLKIDEAKWMYDNIPNGTTVFIK